MFQHLNCTHRADIPVTDTHRDRNTNRLPYTSLAHAHRGTTTETHTPTHEYMYNYTNHTKRWVCIHYVLNCTWWDPLFLVVTRECLAFAVRSLFLGGSWVSGCEWGSLRFTIRILSDHQSSGARLASQSVSGGLHWGDQGYLKTRVSIFFFFFFFSRMGLTKQKKNTQTHTHTKRQLVYFVTQSMAIQQKEAIKQVCAIVSKGGQCRLRLFT